MRVVSTLMIFMVVFAALPPVHGQEECTATFSVDLTSQVDSTLHYKVRVSTSGTRAEVRYKLLLTVATASGESRVVTRYRTVKIGVGAQYDIVRHELEPGETLVGTRAELMSCESRA